jgi:indolepyruvate ferredoxin oxidoreductase beta subunit
MKKMDLLIAGIGGQGNILASDIVGEVAISAGYDVKKTDTIGMAQRGGSVVSNVRIARHVYSPLIKEGDVDILLAFEKLEAARWGYYLRDEGIAIINNHAVPPLSVSMGQDQYPTDERIAGILKQRTDRI